MLKKHCNSGKLTHVHLVPILSPFSPKIISCPISNFEINKNNKQVALFSYNSQKNLQKKKKVSSCGLVVITCGAILELIWDIKA